MGKGKISMSDIMRIQKGEDSHLNKTYMAFKDMDALTQTNWVKEHPEEAVRIIWYMEGKLDMNGL